MTGLCAAQAWRVGSAIGSPGEVVTLDIRLETTPVNSGGELTLGFQSDLFSVENAEPLAGGCVQLGAQRIAASAAGLGAGEHVVCRVAIRIAAAAAGYPNSVRLPYLEDWNCLGEPEGSPCPVELGGIKIRTSLPDPLLSFLPSQPVAHQPFQVVLTMVCDALYDDDRVPYAVKVSPGHVRINVVVMESLPVCPGGESTYHIPVPPLEPGAYRVDVMQRYYGSDATAQRVLNLADIQVADSAAAGGPISIPSAGWKSLAMLAAILGFSVGLQFRRRGVAGRKASRSRRPRCAI